MQWFTFIILAILFMVSPYYRGLYFTADFYGVSLFIFALFIVLFGRWIMYKEVHLLKEVWVVLLIPLCFLIPLPFAESPRGALDVVLKWTCYSAFFLLLYWTTVHMSIKKWVPVIFQLTGIWLTFHMLFIYCGWLTFPNGFVAERFAGVFQYPNTFGMIMGVFLLFSFIMLTEKNITTPYIVLYSCAIVPFFICILLSYSRGMFLILPVMWFMGLCLLSLKKQIEFTVYTFIGALIVLLFVKVITKGDSIHMGLLVVISTLLIVLAKKILSGKLLTRNRIQILSEKKWSRFILPSILVLIGIGGILDLKNHGLVYHSLPLEFQERVESISLKATTAQERFIFVEDALEISEESPLFGMGGEAWATVYKNYQQNPYDSNKTHNGYLEWLLEIGWVGLILVIMVFGYFLFRIFQSILNEKDKSLYVAVMISLLTIFIHSFIDFNFSYSTVWFFVFWLIVMGIATHTNKKQATTMPKKVLYFANISVGLFAILVVISLFFSFQFMQAAKDYKKASEVKTIPGKLDLLESAVQKQPQNIKYLGGLSTVYPSIYSNGVQDRELRNKTHTLLNKMTSLEPGNVDTWFKAGTISIKIGEGEEAIAYFDHALKVDHYNTKLYEISISTKINYVLTHPDATTDYVDSALKDYETMNQLYKNIKKRKLNDSLNSRDFTVNDQIYYYSSLGYFIKGKYQAAIDVYEQAKGHKKIQAKMDAIASLSYERLNDKEKAEEVLTSQERVELSSYITFLEKMSGK
ncbi:O-antigen ligase family protein [Bacillus sp. B1-b2]|uniref:O-antigen ligase family protein n=1 Tax=Bacillus sp. B1-b2 TaxID=2653201 RepID=UPI001262574E|nr:O-antigen ligase family protein [Bacillus sp. B1-b2]KAB7664811.1 O-antigen ligase family protein [Bacillus sp. B1-b2]